MQSDPILILKITIKKLLGDDSLGVLRHNANILQERVVKKGFKGVGSVILSKENTGCLCIKAKPKECGVCVSHSDGNSWWHSKWNRIWWGVIDDKSSKTNGWEPSQRAFFPAHTTTLRPSPPPKKKLRNTNPLASPFVDGSPHWHKFP